MHSQVACQIRSTPVLRDKREDREDWDRQKVVVEHRIPVGEPGYLNALSHSEDLEDRASD